MDIYPPSCGFLVSTVFSFVGDPKHVSTRTVPGSGFGKKAVLIVGLAEQRTVDLVR